MVSVQVSCLLECQNKLHKDHFVVLLGGIVYQHFVEQLLTNHMHHKGYIEAILGHCVCWFKHLLFVLLLQSESQLRQHDNSSSLILTLTMSDGTGDDLSIGCTFLCYWTEWDSVLHGSIKDGSDTSPPYFSKHDIGGCECPFLDTWRGPPGGSTFSFSSRSHFWVGQLMTVL